MSETSPRTRSLYEEYHETRGLTYKEILYWAMDTINKDYDPEPLVAYWKKVSACGGCHDWVSAGHYDECRRCGVLAE